jgi:short-subunit dehydrogenase involved in D-alanine esterification of teichoic acids
LVGVQAPSKKQDSSLIESSKIEIIPPESTTTEARKQDFGNQDSRKLSATKLSSQKFRANTGIPYEILVEVMIRNWENLPQRTQSNYLQQAKQLRINRLMAGHGLGRIHDFRLFKNSGVKFG